MDIDARYQQLLDNIESIVLSQPGSTKEDIIAALENVKTELKSIYKKLDTTIHEMVTYINSKQPDVATNMKLHSEVHNLWSERNFIPFSYSGTPLLRSLWSGFTRIDRKHIQHQFLNVLKTELDQIGANSWDESQIKRLRNICKPVIMSYEREDHLEESEKYPQILEKSCDVQAPHLEAPIR